MNLKSKRFHYVNASNGDHGELTKQDLYEKYRSVYLKVTGMSYDCRASDDDLDRCFFVQRGCLDDVYEEILVIDTAVDYIEALGKKKEQVLEARKLCIFLPDHEEFPPLRFLWACFRTKVFVCYGLNKERGIDYLPIRNLFKRKWHVISTLPFKQVKQELGTSKDLDDYRRKSIYFFHEDRLSNQSYQSRMKSFKEEYRRRRKTREKNNIRLKEEKKRKEEIIKIMKREEKKRKKQFKKTLEEVKQMKVVKIEKTGKKRKTGKGHSQKEKKRRKVSKQIVEYIFDDRSEIVKKLNSKQRNNLMEILKENGGIEVPNLKTNGRSNQASEICAIFKEFFTE